MAIEERVRAAQRFESWQRGVSDGIKLALKIIPPPFLTDHMRQIKAPTELKVLKERLARARELQARVDVIGKRYDAALDLIEERAGVADAHAESLEKYSEELNETIAAMLEGSNSGPTEGGSGSPGSQG